MPQFDTFIFSSTLFFFIFTFFSVLYYNFNSLLPRLSSVLKLRYKFARKNPSVIIEARSVSPTFVPFLSYFVNQNQD